MAVRYSGDVEVRMRRKGGGYSAHVRAPGLQGIAEISDWEAGLGPESALGRRDKLTEPSAYDHVAYLAIRAAEDSWKRELPVEREGDKLILRRRFQAPCPILRPR